MEKYGLVQLRKGQGGTVVPRVPYSGIALAVPFGSAKKDVTPTPVH
jgi:predicted transcriptional regulator